MSGGFGRGAAAKAALLVTGSTYISFFFGLLASALIARGVGPEDFGRYSYVVWIAGILVVVANNGLTSTGLRFISESLGRDDPQRASAVHGWLKRRQHLGVAIASIGFGLTYAFTLPPDWNMPVSVFFGVVLVSLAAKAYYIFEISAAKGHGQFAVEAVSTTVMSTVNLLMTLLLFVLQAPVVAYLVVFASANVAYYAISHRMLASRGIAPANAPLEPELASRIKNHLVWTILLTLAATFGNKASETYLLSNFVGAAEVGYFAIAAALTRGGVELLAAGLNTVLMPMMAHGFGQGGTARVHAILSNSVRLFSFGGLLLAGVGFLWADVVVTLIYGSKYQPAIDVFRVMIVMAGVTLSQSAFGALLSTTDHQRVRAGVAVGSVLISAIAAFALVPRFGLVGAVLSYAISSSVIYVAVCVGIVKVFSVSLPWHELGRLGLAAVAAIFASAAVWWLSNSLLMQFVAGMVFAAVYLTGTVFFRAWRPDDYVQLRPLARRFPRLMARPLATLERWAQR
jgi:O-antigen/teichoic acid export membrane protein